MNEIQAEQYLSRIGIAAPEAPTGAFLARLQYAHLLTVPYENLDILAGKRIILDESVIFGKVVTAHRGGYCFELNLLFSALLRQLGYGVTDCVARYHRGETGMPKRRHRVLLVRAEDGEFLADVGVGAKIPLQPVPYRFDGEFTDCSGSRWALRRDPVLGTVLTEPHGGAWRDVYSFTEEPQQEEDYIFASFWCEFAPESPFTRQYMLSVRRRGDSGCERVTLDGFTLRVHGSGGVLGRELDGAEREAALEEIFGIRL